MMKIDGPLTHEQKEALTETFNDKLAQTERFQKAVDDDELLTLATEEINARWHEFGFDAQLVSPDELPTDHTVLGSTSSEDLDFLLWDEVASDRKELAQRLHEDLVERGYDEQALAASVEAAVLERARTGAEGTTIASGYSNVRAAICGFTVREFAVTPGVQVSGSDNTLTTYSGRITLDLAVWTVPLA